MVIVAHLSCGNHCNQTKSQQHIATTFVLTTMLACANMVELVVTNAGRKRNMAKKTTLRNLSIGNSGRVKTVGGERMLRRRLLEMGITPGTVITTKKIAPLGDPIEIFLRGYVLSIRLDDAERIKIQL